MLVLWNSVRIRLADETTQITKVLSSASQRSLISKWETIPNRTGVSRSKSESSHRHFLGRANTRAEIAEFFSVPPTINGPKGVNTIPWVSARTS